MVVAVQIVAVEVAVAPVDHQVVLVAHQKSLNLKQLIKGQMLQLQDLGILNSFISHVTIIATVEKLKLLLL